jgi:hypothetical protein
MQTARLLVVASLQVTVLRKSLLRKETVGVDLAMLSQTRAQTRMLEPLQVEPGMLPPQVAQ